MLMDSNGKKVLIADDEPDILEIISYNLRNEGYETITAKDGDDALQKASAYKPDLIILDVMMPNKNGMEVCKQLRTQPAFQNTLIIFLTALSDELSQVKGLEYGADDYISKPVSPKVLVSKVNSLFRRVSKPETNKILKLDDLIIDPVQFIVNTREIRSSWPKRNLNCFIFWPPNPAVFSCVMKSSARSGALMLL